MPIDRGRDGSAAPMKPQALIVLACPYCGEGFESVGGAPPSLDAGVLRCRDEGRTFDVEDGVPLLVRAEDAPSLRTFADAYRLAWSRDGWGSLDDGYLRGLPYRDSTRRRSEEWRVKAASMDALLGTLGSSGPLTVLDLGCGIGWLSHHLAAAGHDVYAVDILRDDVLGLGAAGRYARMGPPFERVWGELDHPPFRAATMDVVVCNASLHYAQDPARVLRHVARILKPRGRFVLMNSPVYRDADSANRALSGFREHLRRLGASEDVCEAYHHFQREQILSTLQSTIGPVLEIAYDAGLRFRLSRKGKGLVLGMELASFPILCASPPA